MARTVADAAILLGAMTGVDEQDSATRLSRKRGLSNYTKFLDLDGLKGARIGVARNMAGTNPRIIKIFEHCIEVMKQLGAVIIDPADVPNFDKFGKTELEVLHYEFKADLNKYLKSLDGNARVHSMEDVIKFNEENSDRVMPYFGQEHMLTAQEKDILRDKKYRDALAKNLRLTRKEGIDAAMRKHKLDALDRALRRTCLDDRSGQRRFEQLGHGKHIACRGGGVSAYHGARGVYLWFAGRHFILCARPGRSRP